MFTTGELESVFKPFELKAAQTKGQSDTALYQTATKAVIDRFLREKAAREAESQAPDVPDLPEGPEPGSVIRPGGSSQGSTGPEASGGAGGGASYGSSGGLPNTAMGTGGAGKKLAPIPTIPKGTVVNKGAGGRRNFTESGTKSASRVKPVAKAPAKKPASKQALRPAAVRAMTSL
jgi:hypothetical protein